MCAYLSMCSAREIKLQILWTLFHFLTICIAAYIMQPEQLILAVAIKQELGDLYNTLLTVVSGGRRLRPSSKVTNGTISGCKPSGIDDHSPSSKAPADCLPFCQCTNQAAQRTPITINMPDHSCPRFQALPSCTLA